MRDVVPVALILYLLTAGSVFAQDETALGASQKQDPPTAPCPEVSERGIEGVQNYLTLRYHSSEVEALGLDHLSREDVEPVTNEEACGALFYELENNPGIQGEAAPYGWERHFLQAGDYYFVLLLPDHPDDGLRVYLGPGFIHIFGRHHMNLILSRGPDPNPFEP